VPSFVHLSLPKVLVYTIFNIHLPTVQYLAIQNIPPSTVSIYVCILWLYRQYQPVYSSHIPTVCICLQSPSTEHASAMSTCYQYLFVYNLPNQSICTYIHIYIYLHIYIYTVHSFHLSTVYISTCISIWLPYPSIYLSHLIYGVHQSTIASICIPAMFIYFKKPSSISIHLSTICLVPDNEKPGSQCRRSKAHN
jgi:hypothetical protein